MQILKASERMMKRPGSSPTGGFAATQSHGISPIQTRDRRGDTKAMTTRANALTRASPVSFRTQVGEAPTGEPGLLRPVPRTAGLLDQAKMPSTGKWADPRRRTPQYEVGRSSAGRRPQPRGTAGANMSHHQLPRLTEPVQGWKPRTAPTIQPNQTQFTNQTHFKKWWGVSALQGRRPHMEDEYVVIPSMEELAGVAPGPMGATTRFVGVFDGHAGGRCSKMLVADLAANIAGDEDFHEDLRNAISRGFQKTNADFLRKADRYHMDDGSTAVVVIQRHRHLWVANVGDSRAVLLSGDQAVPLSMDHKPNRPQERRRIIAAGGRVVSCFGVARVNGILAVSRAFGDRNLKSTVRADPEIIERVRARAVTPFHSTCLPPSSPTHTHTRAQWRATPAPFLTDILPRPRT